MESSLWQVWFFRVAPGRISDGEHLSDNDLLGTVIWRQFSEASVALPTRQHVFEGVLRIPPIADYYHHVHRMFRLRFKARDFVIPAVYFTQQDGMTTQCAHSALVTAVNNLARANEHPLTPEGINQALGFDHGNAESRFAWYPLEGYGPEERELASGWAGIDRNMLERILNDNGLSCLLRDYRAWRNCDFENLAYPVIESGFPVLLCFGTERGCSNHVICLLGHTYNSDSWLSQARQGYHYPLPGLARHQAWLWTPHFLCVDDNFGPYYCMDRGALKSPLLYDVAPDLRVNDVVGIVPGRITRDPADAEEDATHWLHALLRTRGAPPDEPAFEWLRRLFEAVGSDTDPPVTRTLLARRCHYREHLLNVCDRSGRESVRNACSELPDLFWITEISLVDLYTANRAKLGEVLQAVDRPEFPEAFLLGRLPGALFKSIDTPPQPFPVNTYIPIYRSVASQAPQVRPFNW